MFEDYEEHNNIDSDYTEVYKNLYKSLPAKQQFEEPDTSILLGSQPEYNIFQSAGPSKKKVTFADPITKSQIKDNFYTSPSENIEYNITGILFISIFIILFLLVNLTIQINKFNFILALLYRQHIMQTNNI